MKRLFSPTRIVAAIGVMLLAGTFTSCLKNNDDVNNNFPVAGLMAFNLSPTKQAVGFSLSGNTLPGGPLPYTSYSGVYLNIYPGTRSVESFDYYSGNTISSSSFLFDSSKYYSVFLVGANGNYSNVVVRDNFDSLSGASGQAYVRYINAIVDSSSAPNVTIGGVVNETAAFKNVSEFKAVTPGQLSIQVSNGGTINASRTISVEQRKVYTILLAGYPGSTNASDSVQIRFIANGELDQEAEGARANSARVSATN